MRNVAQADVSCSTRCAPLHEALNEEVVGDTKLPSQVEQAVKEEEWATNYAQHPVARASPQGTVYPFALYIDGVPFSKHDSFLGFWVCNLVSLKRVLVVVVRKSTMCDCGCKRWCSILPVLQFLLWSFRDLVAGRMPGHRHDGHEWRPEDGDRQKVVGASIIKGAIVLIKGDWSE